MLEITFHQGNSHDSNSLAYAADFHFHFPGGEIEQASEQANLPDVSKKRGSGRGVSTFSTTLTTTPFSLFFALARSFVPFSSFENERLLRRLLVAGEAVI